VIALPDRDGRVRRDSVVVLARLHLAGVDLDRCSGVRLIGVANLGVGRPPAEHLACMR
jgi:hypothetical protein